MTGAPEPLGGQAGVGAIRTSVGSHLVLVRGTRKRAWRLRAERAAPRLFEAKSSDLAPDRWLGAAWQQCQRCSPGKIGVPSATCLPVRIGPRRKLSDLGGKLDA